MRQIYISIIYCSLFARAAFAAILPASLPNGVEGITYKEVQFYSNKVNLKDPSLRWKVLKTPPGITMDPKGRYAGTPTRAGSYTLSVLVYQAIGSRLDLKDSTTITHTISATTPPTINSLTPLPNGRFDMMYAPFSLTATGGIPVSTGVYTWEALPLGSNEFQNIPQGMALSKSGALSGVPTSRAPVPQSSRTYTFRARATDSVGKSATANFTLVINPALPPTILGQCPLPDGIEQIKYKDYKMTGSGGKPPYFWAIQPPQNFPAGLKFDYQTGVISGTPSTYGNFTFQINLVDKNGFSVNKSCSISILPIPHITTNSIFTCATVGKPICSEIEAVGGSKNYKWEILPPLPSNASNLTISTSTASKGLLCGNFSRSSNNTIVTVKVTDTVSSKFTTKSFTFNVRDQLNITSSCPPTEWTSGTPITPILLSANGGSGNYTWSKFDSFNKPWPKGLDLVGNKIQGTPVVSSTTNYTIAYKVADSCGNTDTKNCTVTVYPALTCNSSLGLPCLFEGMTLQEKDVFSATGGKPPYVDWELTPIGSSKALPQGLLQKKPPNGVGNGSVLYGKITENGTFNFTATVTDSLGNKCSKNHSIEVTVLKELWVVVDYKEEDGGHTCNGAAFDLTANGESIMTINLNNVTGKNDWRDNPAGSLIKNACVNGNGTDSSFANPMGIAVSNGTFYIADKENNRVRKIVASPNNSFLGPYGSLSLSQLNFGNTTAKVSTFAGNGEVGFGDGIGGAAILSAPEGVSLDGNGTVYVADTGNNRIRKITASGNVTTLAGNGTAAFGDGIGTAASFSGPRGIAVDGNGTIYVADAGNNRIRKITASGDVTTLAGNGTAAFGDGIGTGASFSDPRGIAVDGNGTIYVADTGNNRIRKITASGDVTTLAGNGTAAFGDGIGTAASFSGPRGIAVDGNRTIYVADTGNNRIRKITASGNVTTFAGNGTAAFGDGNGTAASFSSPSGIEVDGNGTICVADTGNNRIRKISASGNVTTIAGAGTFILPHPESSKGYSRYNRVLVDGKLLEKIKTAQTSNQIIIAATANSTLNTDSTHDPVGRLRIYTNEYSNQDLSKAKIVFDTKNATINQGIANFTSKKPAYIKLCAVLAAPTPTPAPTPALVLAVKLLSLNKKNLISQISDGVQLPVNLQDVSMKRIDIIVPDNFIDKYHLIKTSSFKIANFETTNLQYVAFLNAVAKADALNLYNSLMSNIGIKRSASNGSFSYSVGSGSENYPVTYVSWLDAARYANWLANGKPTGSSGPKTTENGAYNLASSSIVRNTINPNTGAPPTFWLLNESEWYTSAYLKSDATALWSYPTQSNSAPDPTGSKPNNLANFGGVFGETTPVGFFNQSPGPFGTFDQAGNVREWTETIDSNSGKAMRIIRGGSWADPASAMRADESQIADPSLEDDKTGFRIGGAP